MNRYNLTYGMTRYNILMIFITPFVILKNLEVKILQNDSNGNGNILNTLYMDEFNKYIQLIRRSCS